MTRPSDLSERDLLRATAREALASDQALPDLATLGWLGLLTAEDSGGEGWFPLEATLIALEGGHAGTASTWLMNALTAALVSHCPDTAGWTGALVSGERVGSFCAPTELERMGDTVSAAVPRALAERAPDVVVLTGSPATETVALSTDQAGVQMAPEAAALETERSLFRVGIEHAGAHRVPEPMAGTLALTGTVLLCADTVGAVGRAVEIVTRHLVERDAFGVPVASFQVLQHRLVDLVTFHRAAEALVLGAAGALADGEHTAERLALAAHAYIEGRAVQAIDDCIQLAGGIGFTWEFPLHHALRRAATNATLLGSGRTSRHRLAVLGGRAP